MSGESVSAVLKLGMGPENMFFSRREPAYTLPPTGQHQGFITRAEEIKGWIGQRVRLRPFSVSAGSTASRPVCPTSSIVTLRPLRSAVSAKCAPLAPDPTTTIGIHHRSLTAIQREMGSE